LGEVFSRWFIDEEDPDTGDLVDTLAVTRRFDLTDGQWAVLEPLLPAPKRSGRLRSHDPHCRDQRVALIDFDTGPSSVPSARIVTVC
jgi:hypothetical protein